MRRHLRGAPTNVADARRVLTRLVEQRQARA